MLMMIGNIISLFADGITGKLRSSFSLAVICLLRVNFDLFPHLFLFDKHLKVMM